MLTGWGCGEATWCRFLSLISKTEVPAQGSGWNFALDDLAPFAGASAGTARVRPVRKQAPACWLLPLPPHPLSSRSWGPPSQACPQTTQRGEDCPFLGSYRNRARAGCAGGSREG